MKTHKIAVLFAVLLAVLAVACGGRVEYYMSQPGPSGTVVPPATTDAGQPDSAPTSDVVASQDAGMADAVPSSDGYAFSDVQPGSDAGSDIVVADSLMDAPADIQQDVQTDGGATMALFTINLAPDVVSSTYVKKSQNVPALAITITTKDQEIDFSELELEGRGSIASTGCNFGQACAITQLSQRITLLALYDGTTQIGFAKPPDTVTGRANITNLNLKIPANTNKTLIVKMTLASTASTAAPFDKVALGISGNFVATNPNNLPVYTVGYGKILVDQLASNPAVFQTIRPSGTFSITNDNHPTSTIVVAGTGNWTVFARYKATAQYEGAKIDRIAIGNGNISSSADFAAIAIAANGQVIGQNVPPTPTPSNTPWTRDIDLSSNSIAVPKDGSVQFEIWAKVSNVNPWSIGSWGLARSGDTPSLGLASGLTTGEWDPDFAGFHNVRITGSVSGEHLFASGASAGHLMVLRKSKPVITKLPVQSSLVHLGDNAAYHFMMTADTSSVGIAQFAFEVTASKGVAYVPYLLKGGQNVNAWSTAYDPSGDICIWGNGNYCYTGTRRFLWQLQNEEVLAAGSTADYTVMVEVVNNAPPPGSSIAVKFVEQGSLYTAPLTNFNCTTSISLGFGLDSDKNVRPGLIWSDLSEVPHGYQVNCTKPWSSADWIGDVYVKDLSQVQTLTAP